MFYPIEQLHAHERLLLHLLWLGIGCKEQAQVLRTLNPTSPEVWSQVFIAASAHQLSAVVWDGLQQALAHNCFRKAQQPSEQMLRAWETHVRKGEKRFSEQQQVIASLTRFYNARQTPMMLLNGVGIARCYPYPQHRLSGDVDIWLFNRQRLHEKQLLEELHAAVWHDAQRQSLYKVEGVLIENYYKLTPRCAHARYDALEERLQSLADACKIPHTAYYSTPISPSPQFQILFMLCRYAYQFAERGLRLRQLTDWALFCAANHQRIDWHEVNQIASSLGFEAFLEALNRLSVELWGVDRTCFPPLKASAKYTSQLFEAILHPSFTEMRPRRSWSFATVEFTVRRWWNNRANYRMIYRSGRVPALFSQLNHALRKPQID